VKTAVSPSHSRDRAS